MSRASRICSAVVGLLICLPTLLIAAPVNDDFDHFTTGFPLTGAHRGVECDACHNTGQFRGTPRECASCHSLLMNTGAVVKSTKHIQTSNDCEICHSTLMWDDVRRVNHMVVLGDCKSCHYLGSPSGGPPNDASHATNIQDCVNCHRTSTWLSIHFNHGGIAGAPCTNCHSAAHPGGVAARQAPGTAVHTNGIACDSCHNTHSWRFNHAGIARICTDCHLDNGGSYNGIRSKPSGDIHDLIPVGTQCNTCHNTNAWVPATYYHSTPYYTAEMTQHRKASCTDCHKYGYSPAGTYTSTGGFAQSCSGCHAEQYVSSKHHGVSLSTSRDCSGSGCHGYSNW